MNLRWRVASTLLVLSLAIGSAAQADVSQSSSLSVRTLKDLYAFRVGSNHVLYMATLPSGGSWSPWLSFFDGAPLVTSVVAAVGTTGHLEVFATGADTHLYHDYFDGSWHGWTRDFNGAPPLTSVSAANGPDGLMQVFGVGLDGTLVHTSLNQTWSPWVANFDGAPKLSNITAITGTTGHLEVFGVATDGTLVHDTYDGNWYGWDIGFDGAPKVTTVTAVMGTTGHLEVFGIATDGTLVHDMLDTSWHGWDYNFDGAPKLKSIEAMKGATGNLEVFGIAASDGTLVHDSLDTSWHGWGYNFDGAPKLSAIGAAIGPGGHLEVLAAGSDGAMVHDYLDTSWHGWSRYNINSDWMGDLSGTIGSWSINQVKLPGTHDSGTYAITSSGEVTSDAPSWLPIVQSLFGSAASGIVAGWSKAQGWSIPYQLNAGIRYLDLRVCHASDGLRICHALAGDPIGTIIDAVAAFSATHPLEVVILDFNHFYSMTAADHAALASRLSSSLGSRLAPNSLSATTTMSQLWSSGYNVIALYADSATVSANGFLWPQSQIASPWANTTSTATLQTFIQTQPLSRSGSSFFVSQGILTPDTNMIEQGMIPFTSNPSSLLAVANNLNPQLWNWLQTPAIHSQLNIVIADWQADWLIEDIQWLNTF